LEKETVMNKKQSKLLLVYGLIVLASQLSSAAPVQWSGNGHWYEVVFIPGPVATWHEAKTEAEEKGGYLATITSDAENQFVYDLTVNTPGAWEMSAEWATGPTLGGYQDRSAPDYSEPSGGWRWVTGEPWAYTAWLQQPHPQPDDWLNLEDYLSYWGYPNKIMPTWNDGGDICSRYVIEYDSKPLTVEIVGPYSVVLSDPIGANKNLNDKLEALAEPKGGEYEWTVLEGENKIGLSVSNNGQSATVWGTAPSETLQDALIKVTYTLGQQTCSDLHYMTVQKPSLLEIAWGFPDRWVWVNKDGQVIAYSMIYRYGVFDQLSPSNAINVEGMIVSEGLELVSANYGWNQKNLKPYSNKTDILGAFNDEIGVPKSQKWLGFGPAEPIPEDLLIKVRQTILVEGWDVGTRCLTYYYDHATSEPGDCTP
jgi:hypothetical protein